MKRKVIFLYISLTAILLGTVVSFSSCEKLGDIIPELGLSSDEIVKGLKTALDSSAMYSSSTAGVTDGFLKNALIKIPLPDEVRQLQSFVTDNASIPLVSGVKSFLDSQLENLLVSINRAAEGGAAQSYQIFKKAITDITIEDGLKILQGGDMAATNFLKEKTFAPLSDAFAPIVDDVIAQGDVSQYWSSVTEKYNQFAPVATTLGYNGPREVNTNLSTYITEKGLDGLFKLVGQEEAKIRSNPLKYASDIIQKVFGSPQAKQRQ